MRRDLSVCPTWGINIDTALPWTLSTQKGKSYGQLLSRNAGGGGLYLKRRLLTTKTLSRTALPFSHWMQSFLKVPLK